MTTQREPAFVIDPRARAMLAEMGIRVWLPVEVPQAGPLQATAIANPKSATLGASNPDTTGSPTQTLAAVPLRREPPLRLPVMDAPPVATLDEARYVIANMPSDPASYDLIVLGEPCQGAAASLLTNMLKVFQGRCFFAELVASHNDAIRLQDQLATLPTKLTLALGPHAAKALLAEVAIGIPFSKLRGSVYTPKALVTYHPQQLVRQPIAKAQAWMDIKLTLRTLQSTTKTSS